MREEEKGRRKEEEKGEYKETGKGEGEESEGGWKENIIRTFDKNLDELALDKLSSDELGINPCLHTFWHVIPQFITPRAHARRG